MGEGLEPTTGQAIADPIEDTPDAPDGDTGADTPTDTTPVDWQKRYTELRSLTDRRNSKLDERERRIREAEDRLIQSRTGTTPAPAPAQEQQTAVPPDVERELAELRQFRAQQEWAAVTQEYGEPMLKAYSEFQRNYLLDQTPRGVMNAFAEAIRVHEEAKAAKPADQGKPTRRQAVEPRVDANRSDSPDRSAFDKQIEDAKAGKVKDPMLTGVSALLRKAGW